MSSPKRVRFLCVVITTGWTLSAKFRPATAGQNSIVVTRTNRTTRAPYLDNAQDSPTLLLHLRAQELGGGRIWVRYASPSPQRVVSCQSISTAAKRTSEVCFELFVSSRVTVSPCSLAI